MANDGPDNSAIKVPPPLIYLLPLVSGLHLDRRVHVSFFHAVWHAATGGYSWPAGALLGWFLRMVPGADVPLYAPTSRCQD